MRKGEGMIEESKLQLLSPSKFLLLEFYLYQHLPAEIMPIC